jgi:hypothetical protein
MDGAAAKKESVVGASTVSDADLLIAIEGRHQEARAERRRRFRRLVETECPDELSRFDLALVALNGGKDAAGPAKPAPTSSPPGRVKPRRRRRVVASTKPAAVKERLDATLRYLVEAEHAVAPREIQRDLNMTPSCIQSATTRLCREGKAVRTGTGISTRYEAKQGAVAQLRASTSPPHHDSTPAGRILETVEQRNYATPAEVAQASGLPLEESEKVCGELLAEEELKMDRIDGRPVYLRCQPA